jgi:negative regulator of sigma E activity
MIENISAWMDGELNIELNIEQARPLPEQIKRDACLRIAWDYYHIIGDTLRRLGLVL